MIYHVLVATRKETLEARTTREARCDQEGAKGHVDYVGLMVYSNMP